MTTMASGAPSDAEAWGWRLESGEGTWLPKGEKTGWIDDQALYLEPDAAFAVAQKLARDQNDALPVTQRTLHKRLKEGNYLENSHDSTRTTLTVRRTIEGQRRPILHLRKDIFSERLSPCTEHDQHDQSVNGKTMYEAVRQPFVLELASRKDGPLSSTAARQTA